TVTNQTTVGSLVTNVTYSYLIDQTAVETSFSGTPVTFTNNSADLTIPGGAALGVNYFVHFRVDYTGTPAGPVDWDSAAINFSYVQDAPSINSVSGIFSGIPPYAKTGSAVTMNDAGDSGKAAVACVWGFGDGTTNVTTT